MPNICAANQPSFIQWFAWLKDIIHHPRLQEEEKYLCLWLFANQSTNIPSFSCSVTYEQISVAMNKPPRLIHRLLFRLLIHGCLIADIPVFYGEPTVEMMQKVRTIKLITPPKTPLSQEEEQATILPRKYCKSITLNLINNQQEEKSTKPASLYHYLFRTFVKS